MPRAACTMRASSAAWWSDVGSAQLGPCSQWRPYLSSRRLFERLALHLVVRPSARGGVAELVGGAGDFVAQLEVVGEALRRRACRPRSPRAPRSRVRAACLQSRNRHCSASASMSLKFSATSSSPVGLSSRMPGVSIRQAPERQRDQRAMRGGVAAARIALAHFAGLHPLDAEQGVGQRGLAGAGGADQHGGAARAAAMASSAATLSRILGVDRDARRRPARRVRARRSASSTASASSARRLVGLGQHHHRLDAAAAHQQQVALDAARIEVGIEAADDEHGVDVGGDQLLLVVLAGGAALDRACGAAAARRSCCAFDQHPVADRRRALPGRCRPCGSWTARCHSGRDSTGEAVLGAVGDDVAAAVLLDHPRRARLRVRRTSASRQAGVRRAMPSAASGQPMACRAASPGSSGGGMRHAPDSSALGHARPDATAADCRGPTG